MKTFALSAAFGAALWGAALLGLPSPAWAQPSEVILEPYQATAADLVSAGPLQLGMSAEAAASVLGTPSDETAPTLNAATGGHDKEWHFAESGVTLTLSAKQPGGPYQVEAIVLQAPCTYAVATGITIGTLETEAFQRFKALINEDLNSYRGSSDDSFGVLANSTYTLLLTDCVYGVVQRIYLGPGPE